MHYQRQNHVSFNECPHFTQKPLANGGFRVPHLLQTRPLGGDERSLGTTKLATAATSRTNAKVSPNAFPSNCVVVVETCVNVLVTVAVTVSLTTGLKVDVIVVTVDCVTVCVSPIVEFSVSVVVTYAVVGLVIVVTTVFVE